MYPYISEGFGEDFVPANYDMQYIDKFEKVTDKDGAIMARRIAKEEGMFCGYSAGSCLQGLIQLKNETDNRIYINLQKQYNEYVVSKLPKHQQTIGLVIGNIRYVLLDNNDSMSFYQVEFDTTLNVNWTFVQKNNVIEYLLQ